MRWLFTSDLHGQQSLYEQVVALAAHHRPEAVLLGGDLAPHAPGQAGVERQRVFLEGFFIEFARRLREATPESALLVLMGNDDWAANADVLERHDGRLWRMLHQRTVEVNGARVAGLSWVPITPFAIKDWDRWDDGGDETPARLEGVVSHTGRLTPHRFDPDHREPTIAQALDELAAAADPSATVFVLHSPPRDTRCDVTHAGTHVGSRAIRAFLARHQPPVVLSGHIHESPRVSGAWRDRIGATTVVNPGQFGTPGLCAVWLDPADPAGSLQHTIHT